MEEKSNVDVMVVERRGDRHGKVRTLFGFSSRNGLNSGMMRPGDPRG